MIRGCRMYFARPASSLEQETLASARRPLSPLLARVSMIVSELCALHGGAMRSLSSAQTFNAISL